MNSGQNLLDEPISLDSCDIVHQKVGSRTEAIFTADVREGPLLGNLESGRARQL